jgi:group I intron endonuclease
MDKRCGVYLITSPSNGRYVGSSKRLDKRVNRYKNCSCSGQSAIYNSIKKYGWEAHTFKVLIYCEEVERLMWERVFGDLYLSSVEHSNGLNLLLPGYDDIPALTTQQFKEKISITQKIRFSNPEQRLNTSIRTKAGFTTEVRESMSQLHKNRFIDNPELRVERSEVRKAYYKRNPEAKLAASKRQKLAFANDPELKERCLSGWIKYKKENPDAHSKKMKQRFIDNPELSKEHSERMRKLYRDNPELRKAASEKTKIQLLKNGHNMSKRVINTETNHIYKTVKEAAASTKYCENTFREILKDRHKIKLPYKYL